jgi:hypothetical protein
MTTRTTFLLLTGSEGAEKLLVAESKKTATTINMTNKSDKMRGFTALMPSPVKDCFHVYVICELAVTAPEDL